MYANHSGSNYITAGKAKLSFQIINQRADFSFALFTGGLENVSRLFLSTVFIIYILNIIHKALILLTDYVIWNTAKSGGCFRSYIICEP